MHRHINTHTHINRQTHLQKHNTETQRHTDTDTQTMTHTQTQTQTHTPVDLCSLIIAYSFLFSASARKDINMDSCLDWKSTIKSNNVRN